MSNVTIKTNNIPRQLKYGYDMPEKYKADFDYIDAEEFDSHNFVEYKGVWYDLGEFTRISHEYWGVSGIEKIKEWHGISYDSAFSGVLIKLCKDSDYVIMASYYC
jgi:hypothetical protein